MLTALKRAYLHPEAQHKIWVKCQNARSRGADLTREMPAHEHGYEIPHETGKASL